MILIAPRSISDTVSINTGQIVEVETGWTTSTDFRIFYGYIETYEPDGGFVRIRCKAEIWDLIRKNVNKVYDSGIDASAGEISAIAVDLIETYGGMTASAQSSGTAEGNTIDVFKSIHTDIYGRVMTLAKALDWQVHYKASDKKVYFEPRGYTDSGITLTVIP